MTQIQLTIKQLSVMEDLYNSLNDAIEYSEEINTGIIMYESSLVAIKQQMLIFQQELSNTPPTTYDEDDPDAS